MALDSRLLDGNESPQTWTVTNVDQAHGDLTLTKERVVTGASAVRFPLLWHDSRQIGRAHV